MLCRFSLGVGLFLACASPALMAEQPKSISARSAQPITSAASSDGGVVYTMSDLGPAHGDVCPRCGYCGQGSRPVCANGCLNTCNMPQHHRYYPTSQGYYYFRPYQNGYVPQQQRAVTRYGGDPRNPYDNSIPARVYAELGIPAEAAPAKKETSTASPPDAPAARQLMNRKSPRAPLPVESAPVESSPVPVPAVPEPEPVEAAPAMRPVPAEKVPALAEPQTKLLRKRVPESVVKFCSDPLAGLGLAAAPAPSVRVVSEVPRIREVPEPPTAHEPTPAEPHILTASQTQSLPIVSAALPIAYRGEATKRNATTTVLSVPASRQESVATNIHSQSVVTMASVIQFPPEGSNRTPAGQSVERKRGERKQGDSRSRAVARVKK